MYPLPEKDFNAMINAKMKTPGNKAIKCANITTVKCNSDSIVDVRKVRKKHRKIDVVIPENKK